MNWTRILVLLASLGLVLLASLGFASAATADTLIHAGWLIDGRSDTAVSEQTVVVRDGKIVEIAAGYRSGGANDEVVDLRDATVMPGLMDMHTHLSHEGSPTSYVDRIRLNSETYAIRSTVYAERTLMAGFTTVRDVGDDGKIIVALRDAVAAGWVPGPRIFTAGKSLATTGGHADPSNGLRASLTGNPGPEDGVVNSPEDAAKAVRQRYKEGADLIKITATGGVLSLAKNSQNPQFSDAELVAVVNTAKDYGFHVAAHAHGADGMKRAIRAGVKTIEHGTYMDDEAMELMKQHDTFLVPTLMAGEHVAEKSKIDGYYPDVVRPKAAAVGPVMQGTFTKAYNAGVNIAFGTDSGVSPHGENAREFFLMVDGGMPAMEAIHSATRVTAELLGIDDRLGTLEAGKVADIVAVPGNPLTDINVMMNVSFVMKEGRVFKEP